MVSFSYLSPTERCAELAQRLRDRRLDQNLTQEGLAVRAGVPYGTLKLFERQGKGSFELVMKLAYALSLEDGFDALFSAPPVRSLDDLDDGPRRMRGTRR